MRRTVNTHIWSTLACLCVICSSKWIQIMTDHNGYDVAHWDTTSPLLRLNSHCNPPHCTLAIKLYSSKYWPRLNPLFLPLLYIHTYTTHTIHTHHTPITQSIAVSYPSSWYGQREGIIPGNTKNANFRIPHPLPKTLLCHQYAYLYVRTTRTLMTRWFIVEKVDDNYSQKF